MKDERLVPVRLDRFDSSRFSRGRSRATEALWFIVDTLLIRSRLPGSAHRRWLLRLFGASVGDNVVIKPGVRVKFPWRLAIGSNTWIGEDAWIDNLEDVNIGRNCCISQGVYICTGSHNWNSPGFDLIVKPVRIDDGAWLGARSVIGPGIVVGEGAVLALGSVATKDLTSWSIYRGVPASLTGDRRLSTFPNSECP